MNILFFGTPQFAVPALKALVENHTVVAVVTQPDKKRGRGQKSSLEAVKQEALNQGIEVRQPEKLSPQVIEQLAELKPDIGVVVSYGKILPTDLLKVPTYGFINIHPSLLPLYRGANPIGLPIRQGDALTGVTIMKVSPELDAGDILWVEEQTISTEDTFQTMHDYLAQIGARGLIETLKQIEANKECVGEVQNHAQATYTQKVDRDFCHIPWDQTSEDVCNWVRSVSPKPGAFSLWQETVLKIIGCIQLGEALPPEDLVSPGVFVGFVKNKGPIVQTKDGAVILTEVQIQGGKVMSGQAFLNGYGAHLKGQQLR